MRRGRSWLCLRRLFAEEEIHRGEGRRAQWERAAALVAAHPHGPFAGEVLTTVGGETFQALTSRAEAGAAVRRLVHAYQSAAAFGRQRLRGVVARYRGLDLVVQAHAVFAADLSLALPDSATLDAVTAATDTGIWQSVGRTVSEIPSMLARLQGRIAEAHERIATIDRELTRLEAWDGQATYAAAVSELSAINAAFAAAEERAGTERSLSETTTETQPAPDDATLAEILLSLAQAERIGDDEDQSLRCIPPAPASLAWMAAQNKQITITRPAAQPEEAVVIPALPTPLPAIVRHRPVMPRATQSDAFQQLPLF